MSLSKLFIEEFKEEAVATRALLAVVPLDKGDWKPHTKSFALAPLAIHVAQIMGWAKETITQDVLDFAAMGERPKDPSTTEELLALFDKNFAASMEVLENVNDSEFDRDWTMRAGDQVYFTLPKGKVYRTWCLNHLYHHRAQLGVYLRMLDVSLPGTYGPSADQQ
jgi:uncharacterized damage-inducible protein DinB